MDQPPSPARMANRRKRLARALAFHLHYAPDADGLRMLSHPHDRHAHPKRLRAHRPFPDLVGPVAAAHAMARAPRPQPQPPAFPKSQQCLPPQTGPPHLALFRRSRRPRHELAPARQHPALAAHRSSPAHLAHQHRLLAHLRSRRARLRLSHRRRFLPPLHPNTRHPRPPGTLRRPHPQLVRHPNPKTIGAPLCFDSRQRQSHRLPVGPRTRLPGRHPRPRPRPAMHARTHRYPFDPPPILRPRHSRQCPPRHLAAPVTRQSRRPRPHRPPTPGRRPTPTITRNRTRRRTRLLGLAPRIRTQILDRNRRALPQMDGDAHASPRRNRAGSRKSYRPSPPPRRARHPVVARLSVRPLRPRR